jgi:hypothetical protein
MKLVNRIGRSAALLVAFVLVFAVSAQAQRVNDSPASVSLSMSVGETLTVSASPASISFTYDGINTATASGPITVTTTANLIAGNHSQILVGSWLSSASAALAGPQNIPSSEVYEAVNSGSPYACNVNVNVHFLYGVAGAGCVSAAGAGLIDNSTAGVAAGGIIVLTDNVVLSLSGLGVLQAGTYTGTVNFESQVI